MFLSKTGKDVLVNDPNGPNLSRLAELSDLLVTTVQAVVKSQETLDDYTRRRQEEYNAAPEGELAIPPLWYAISDVAVELELSASVTEERVVGPDGVETLRSRLNCKTLNPLSVGLFGYQASAGLRVRLQLGPRGVLPIKAGD